MYENFYLWSEDVWKLIDNHVRSLTIQDMSQHILLSTIPLLVMQLIQNLTIIYAYHQIPWLRSIINLSDILNTTHETFKTNLFKFYK